jgi:hypothetical protein
MGGGGTSSTEVHSYYYYKVKLAHMNIISTEEIVLYNEVGEIVYTVPTSCQYVDYGNGIISVPGNEQNGIVESIASASYWVNFSTSDIIIDYDNAEFKISKTLVKNPAQIAVWGTFEYWSVVTAVKDIASVIDGRWDTQVQTVFYAEPPMGYNYAIVDLGAIYNIQAVDFIAGFFKPEADPNIKIDIDMRVTIQYSLDNINYYEISEKTHNIQLTGGSSHSLEEDDLGVEFQTRYLKVILEKIKKIEYGQKKDMNGVVIQTGCWPVAFTEVSAYSDIILKREAKLIRTTYTTAIVNINEAAPSGETYTINVESTGGFDPAGTAYINIDEFIYTGLTATSFTGCSGLNTDHLINEQVTQSLESDTEIYDPDGLLDHLGDRVYKLMKIDDKTLFSEEESDRVAKAYLREFYKDHRKVTVQCLYAPFINVGHTVRLIDPYNNTATNFFVQSVKDIKGAYELILARYPA